MIRLMEAACSALIVSDDDHEGVEAPVPWEIDGLMEGENDGRVVSTLTFLIMTHIDEGWSFHIFPPSLPPSPTDYLRPHAVVLASTIGLALTIYCDLS